MPLDNKYVGQEFLSLPKEHHHVSRLMVLSVILGFVVVISGVGAWYATSEPKQFNDNVATTSITPVANNNAAEAQRASVLVEAATKNASTLTTKQQSEIMVQASKGKAHTYTSEESSALVQQASQNYYNK